MSDCQAECRLKVLDCGSVRLLHQYHHSPLECATGSTVRDQANSLESHKKTVDFFTKRTSLSGLCGTNKSLSQKPVNPVRLAQFRNKVKTPVESLFQTEEINEAAMNIMLDVADSDTYVCGGRVKVSMVLGRGRGRG